MLPFVHDYCVLRQTGVNLQRRVGVLAVFLLKTPERLKLYSMSCHLALHSTFLFPLRQCVVCLLLL